MGKLEALEIAFNENKDVYTPGESISGKVTVKLNQPIQCKGRKLPLKSLACWENVPVAEQGSVETCPDLLRVTLLGFTSETCWI